MSIFYCDHIYQILWELHKLIRRYRKKDVKKMLFERCINWVWSGLAWVWPKSAIAGQSAVY